LFHTAPSVPHYSSKYIDTRKLIKVACD